jgi:hypothetical protein
VETSQRSACASSESHETSLIVWDLPPTIDPGAPYRFKVGVKCAKGCRVNEWSVEIHDDAGRALASVALHDTPWNGTTSLYYADVVLCAAETDGLHSCEARVAAVPAEGPDATAHAAAHTRFNVRVVPSGQCVLKVVAVDARTRAPVEGARVVVHPYRTATDKDGVAELRVPRGAYRVFVSGRHYFPFRSDIEIETGMTIRAELDADVGLSEAELWA